MYIVCHSRPQVWLLPFQYNGRQGLGFYLDILGKIRFLQICSYSIILGIWKMLNKICQLPSPRDPVDNMLNIFLSPKEYARIASPQHFSLKTPPKKRKKKRKKKAFTDMLKTNFRKEENGLDQISLLNRPF